MRAAAIQLNSTADKARNLERCGAARGRRRRGRRRARRAAGEVEPAGLAEELTAGASRSTGPTISAARGWARELGIHLVAGSIAERVEGADRLFNTSCAIDPDGEIVAVYRKIHMFDVDVGGVSYRESDTRAARRRDRRAPARRASSSG